MSIWTDIHKRSNGVALKQEDIIFEEMVYSRERKFEIIAHNIYKGVEYFVVNYGHHPAGYIACDKSFLDKYADDWGNIDVIDVHGGVTFTGDLYGLKAIDSKLPGVHGGVTFTGNDLTAIDKERKLYGFGWDYAHAGDWAGYMPDIMNEGSRKYDTWMVVEECKSAIDQYLEIQKNDDMKNKKIYSTSFAPVTVISKMNEKLQIHTMK